MVAPIDDPALLFDSIARLMGINHPIKRKNTGNSGGFLSFSLEGTGRYACDKPEGCLALPSGEAASNKDK